MKLISITIAVFAASLLKLVASNNPPVVLVHPLSNTHFHPGDSRLEVSVRATGAEGVTDIFCVLNGDTKDLPTDIRFDKPVKATNWTFSLDLSSAPGAVPGTNVASIFALDAQAEYSNTNSVTVFYAVTNTLTLQTSGAGVVRGLVNGQILNLGEGYPVVAMASNGWILQSWTDSQGFVLSPLPSFSFLDDRDATLVANFVSNPFPPLAGNYRGLFLDADDGVESTNSGFITFTMDSNGVFSGKILFGLDTYPFASRLFTTFGEPLSDDIPFGNFRINLKKGGVWEFALQLNDDTNLLDPGAGALSGTVAAYADASETCLLWTAQLYAERSTTPPNLPPAGLYNLALAPVSLFAASAGPAGYSDGSLHLSENGSIVMSYNLADGSPRITFATATAWDRNFPFFAPLYKGGGVLIGWLNFTNGSSPDQGVNIDIENDYMAWSKLPSPGGTYTNGFNTASTSLIGYGSRYPVPRVGTNIWSHTNLLFQVNYDPSNQTNVVPIVFNPRNNAMTVHAPNPTGLAITFDAATGDYHGSVAPGTNSHRISFQGNLMPGFKQGWGFYLNTNQQTGSVSIYGR